MVEQQTRVAIEEPSKGRGKISLFDQKNTSPFMYWQRWKAHGNGGSSAGCIKDPSDDDFTICVLETQNIFMGWKTICRYKQKAYSGEFYGRFVAAIEYFWRELGVWKSFFQTLKHHKGNGINSTRTSNHVVTRAQQVAQEVLGLRRQMALHGLSVFSGWN